MYDLARLNAELAGTAFAGKVSYARVTGSTNADAVAAAKAGAAHGAVYLADEQTSGRGRSDHEWASAAGAGIYVSAVQRLQIPAARLLLLPLAAGLAAAEAMRAAAGIAADLRWPNDVLIGPRKVAGILVESQSGGEGFAVVGIGINVHQREFSARLATPATSLDLEAGRRVSRQAVLVALLRALERETQALADEDEARKIPGRVERASTWVRGRSVEVHGPQACSGVTAGLDGNGFLCVETAAGVVVVQTGGLREKSSF
jgi:BirA family biotin operon repressor/biotin-[acetyl-CoA-carboxylase] ligase